MGKRGRFKISPLEYKLLSEAVPDLKKSFSQCYLLKLWIYKGVVLCGQAGQFCTDSWNGRHSRGGSSWSPLLRHDLLMVSRSDHDNPVSPQHTVHTFSLSLCQRLKLLECLKSCSFVLYILWIWTTTQCLTKPFSVFFTTKTENSQSLGIIWQMASYVSLLLPYMLQPICKNVSRNKCVICLKWVQEAHTCRRSGESIAVMWRRQKRWNREQRALLHPRTLLFQAFLIILRTRGTMHRQAHLEHSQRAAQSALFENGRKRKIKVPKSIKEYGRGERYRQQGDKCYTWRVYCLSRIFTQVGSRKCIKMTFFHLFFSFILASSVTKSIRHKTEQETWKVI